MELFGFLRPRTQDEVIEKFININLKNKTVTRFRMPFIDSALKGFLEIQFFNADRAFSNTLKSLIEKHNIRHQQRFNTTLLIGNKNIYSILYSPEGMVETVNALYHITDKNDEELREQLTTVRFQLQGCSNRLCTPFQEIAQDLPVVLMDNCIELHQNIIPDKFVHNGNLSEILEGNRITINKLTIYSNPDGELLSVRTQGFHPNSDDNGWYCLGELKFKRLTKDLIYKLIDELKYYRLDDCYYMPSWNNQKEV
ncbi:MAG: hypothetical protein KAS32_29225 [Candidatus Peribacteraceae bacterium]|nr:hypothetical protein [Candidatus Peribacteraceae bacterium]